MKTNMVSRLVSLLLVLLCLAPTLAFASVQAPTPPPPDPVLSIPRPQLDDIILDSKRGTRLFINYYRLDAMLYDDETGENILFLGTASRLGGRRYAVTMHTALEYGSLALSISPKTVKYLLGVYITTIRIADGRYAQEEDYVEYDLRALREWAKENGIDAEATLYLTGPNDEIIVK